MSLPLYDLGREGSNPYVTLKEKDSQGRQYGVVVYPGHDSVHVVLDGGSGSMQTVILVIGSLGDCRRLEELSGRDDCRRVATAFERHGDARFRSIDVDLIEKLRDVEAALIADGDLRSVSNETMPSVERAADGGVVQTA